MGGRVLGLRVLGKQGWREEGRGAGAGPPGPGRLRWEGVLRSRVKGQVEPAGRGHIVGGLGRR